MKKKLVSIIIPFYNAQKYMESCIKNISEQTYLNVEYIFVDDGSTDNSKIIFQKYKNNQMIYIYQKNKGVSASRNLGIEHAKGYYIGFLDIDDIVENNFIEKMVNQIEKDNTDIVLCDYTDDYPTHSEEITLPWNNEIIDSIEIKNKLIPMMIYPMKNEKLVCGMIWRLLTKKEIINKYNIKFNINVSIAEDLLFSIELFNQVKSISILSECLYHHYKNNNSAVNRYINNFLNNQILYHKIFVDLLKTQNLYKNNILRYEKNKIRMYTSALSNVARNSNKKERKKEICKIYEEYKKENINISKHEFPILIKLTYFLLNHKMLNTLLALYNVKEKIRRKNLKG